MGMKNKRAKAAASKPIVELVVRRGALRRFDKLKQATATLPVKLSWDRRTAKQTHVPSGVGRDAAVPERRREPPFTWDAADFVVVDARPRRARRKRLP
jgi:hypothetical protein